MKADINLVNKEMMMNPDEIAMAFSNVMSANKQNDILTEAYRDYIPLNRKKFTDAEMNMAKTLFDNASHFDVGGWILPDGTVLDFKSSSNADHAEIFRSFSNDRIKDALEFFGKDSGPILPDEVSSWKYYTEWKEEALAAGLIRLQCTRTGVYITLWKKPTEQQLDRLYDFIDACEESQDADFFQILAISAGDKYEEYQDIDDFSRRAINDIKKFSANL